MIDKLQKILKNYLSITEQMANPDIISNIAEYSRLAKEHRKMSETVMLAKEYIKIYLGGKRHRGLSPLGEICNSTIR